MKLKDLCGTHIFSGVELGKTEYESFGYVEQTNYVKFTLDGTHYYAIENPSDGYRSYMEEMQISENSPEIKIPFVEVLCRMRDSNIYETNEVLDFIDLKNGKKIFSVGTANTDDYYPYVVFEYHPENIHYNENR